MSLVQPWELLQRVVRNVFPTASVDASLSLLGILSAAASPSNPDLQMPLTSPATVGPDTDRVGGAARGGCATGVKDGATHHQLVRDYSAAVNRAMRRERMLATTRAATREGKE